MTTTTNSNSASTELSFSTSISIARVPALISALGSEITFMLLGEPGIGKTTVLKMLKEVHKDAYHYVYIDGPATDYGDLAMKIPVHSEKAIVQYLSERFPRDGKPFIVMIDEIGKMNRMMRLVMTRLMLEKSLGDEQLPEGSVVFATSNNTSDGIGDTFGAHEGNRVTLIDVAKPTASEWLVWASDHGVNSVVRAWVEMNKQCMRSYREQGQGENPYIFNPTRSHALSFVTPRSLVKAGKIVDKVKVLGRDATLTALAGTVGHSAAESMVSFLALNEKILSTSQIIADPQGAPVPDSMAAVFMMMFNIIDDIQTQDDLTACMDYIDRVGSREVESVFFSMLVQTKRTVRMALGNARVKSWADKNFELL